ncbi:ribosomal protein S6 kinase alpha-5-like isoform X1 [Portunus trituberculatus]|uniref:non-specific serine/threonine protein kinase n=2 Tax=Portunus trituberculatus TaxID=210409 RepID=A0A5B7CFU3_PORTR|nr:ribosomal protein S6 kinase alpha-5-like isoform X1 [Portunus trituberculatus]XP_045109794.1 ribosomal protein S6 kinase alpha-5-like isoform X1 [Portunus trituberculatus]XP_045109796.1 ribosomal protein S6 kinase alpha-5-like isoform X1 [Portunus trituberculatus]MPC08502.1 Ribosomal protein S6 kinase alpha-5 [Portunus trituberculatus]
MGVHRTEEPGGGLGILEEEEEDEDLGMGRFYPHYPHRQDSGASSTNSDVLNNNQVDGGKVNLTGKGRVDMAHFELLKVLGTGAYGKVFLVRKISGKDAGKLYAMKVLKKATIVQKKKTTEHTKTERQVLEAVRQSPFLVTLHYAFQTDAKLHLILDYVSGGELFTHLYQRERFREDEVRLYIGEVILALEHLHKLGIIYRDIKLENILLDSDGHIVLTDFGLSKDFLSHETEHRAYSFCGTIEYMAPEVVQGGAHGHDQAVDWWSVGVLTYELLTGASPFTVEGEKNNQQEISRRILKTQPPLPNDLSPEVRDLISRLLVKDPRQRLGGGPQDALEIKQHVFFKKLNWDDLAQKKVPAPFVPRISNELDVSNFSEEFTAMIPQDSPAIVPPDVEKMFNGYSYVAPSILFTDNVISDSLFKMSPDRRPSTTNLLACSFKDSPFFQQYELDFQDNILGDGSFSVCRECIQKSTGQHFAVKIVSRRLDCQQEINLLRACQGHSNIVNLHEVFHDEAHTYIVMELLGGGELLQRIRKHERFTEAKASVIMRSLVSAVHYMHRKGIVHRDLKPENLLFKDSSEDSVIKIVDFGFARLMPDKEKDGSMKTPCFTLHYAAPEVLRQAVQKGANGYDETCDWWSLGVILYTMLSGRAPFQSRSKDDTSASIIARIKDGSFDMSGPEWVSVSSQAKKLIKGLLTVDASRRLTITELLQDEWLQGGPPYLFSATPLMTPTILSARPTLTGPISAEAGVKQAFHAFHMATREGFRLLDVSNARLAQRRKNKKSSTDARSHSSTSSLSSTSSASSLNSTCTPSKSDRCSSSLGATPKKEESIFDFGEAKVKAYLSSIDSPSETSFPVTPSMVLTLPSLQSKSTTGSSDHGSFDFPKENRTGETVTKPKSNASVPPEESSLSASKVSYNKEQCLAFKKQTDGCDMGQNVLHSKSSGSSQKFFPSDFTGPQTRSRKRKLEKMSEGDVTIVKHMFKGRNTRSKRFDTIVIDD